MPMMEEAVGRFDRAAAWTAPRLRAALVRLSDPDKAAVREIRLRAGGPLALTLPQGCRFVEPTGHPVAQPTGRELRCRPEEVVETFRALCGYSVHAHEQELRQGFLSLPFGHRAGVCGTAVWDGDRLQGVKDISSLNIRLARQVTGAADGVWPLFVGGVCSLLVAGPPGSGKTTLLRDLARRLAEGPVPRTVAVVDERGELAAAWQGVPQNDLGLCCDVLTGFDKARGILTAVRCLAPAVIVCDELGGAEEMTAVADCLSAGVAVVASVHAAALREVTGRPALGRLLRAGAFTHLALLGGGGVPCQVIWQGRVAQAFAETDRDFADGGGDTGGGLADGNGTDGSPA